MCQVPSMLYIKFLGIEVQNMKKNGIKNNNNNTFEIDWWMCVQIYFYIRKINEINIKLGYENHQVFQKFIKIIYYTFFLLELIWHLLNTYLKQNSTFKNWHKKITYIICRKKLVDIMLTIIDEQRFFDTLHKMLNVEMVGVDIKDLDIL